MDEQKKGMSKGCLIALVIAGVVLVIIVAMSIVCYTKRDKIMEWGIVKMMETTQKDILANLPDGMTEENAGKVMSDFEQAVKEKRVHAQDMQNIAFTYQEAYKDKKLDKDEAGILLEQMRKVANADSSSIQPLAPQ